MITFTKHYSQVNLKKKVIFISGILLTIVSLWIIFNSVEINLLVTNLLKFNLKFLPVLYAVLIGLTGQIEIVLPQKKGKTFSEKGSLRKHHRRRSSIEANISLLKNKHRLNRYYYRHMVDDSLNLLLSTSAYYFKRIMRIMGGEYEIFSQYSKLKNRNWDFLRMNIRFLLYTN